MSTVLVKPILKDILLDTVLPRFPSGATLEQLAAHIEEYRLIQRQEYKVKHILLPHLKSLIRHGEVWEEKGVYYKV